MSASEPGQIYLPETLVVQLGSPRADRPAGPPRQLPGVRDVDERPMFVVRYRSFAGDLSVTLPGENTDILVLKKPFISVLPAYRILNPVEHAATFQVMTLVLQPKPGNASKHKDSEVVWQLTSASKDILAQCFQISAKTSEFSLKEFHYHHVVTSDYEVRARESLFATIVREKVYVQGRQIHHGARWMVSIKDSKVLPPNLTLGMLVAMALTSC